MSFQVKRSIKSASILQVVELIIDQLTEHEDLVFKEARTRDDYAELLMAHPVIIAAFKNRK